MLVPTAVIPGPSGGGQFDHGGTQLPNWAIPIWPGSYSQWDDQSNYFWCTHGRDQNDCLHSRRVGVVTGKRVPPIFEVDGLRYVWELEFFDHPAYPGWDSAPIGMGYADGDISLMVQVGHATGGIPRTEVTLTVAYAYDILPNGRVRYVRNNVRATVAYPSTLDGSISSVQITNPLWGGKVKWDQAEQLDAMCRAMLDKIPIQIKSGKRTVWNPEYFSATRALTPIALTACQGLAAFVRRSAAPNWKWSAKLPSNYELEQVGPHFIFDEVSRVCSHSSVVSMTNYWWNVLKQNAYLSCLQSMPRLNENSISNLIELVGFVKALVVDKRIDIPKSLQSAWLSYRYQYQTTKMDADQAIKFVKRFTDLNGLPQGMSCHGEHRILYKYKDQDVSVTCRCRADLLSKELTSFHEIWRALYTYGLQPNFYVIWDMIPYSFVVDWFIPVGNLAAVIDARNQYSGTNYAISNIVYSISYDVVDTVGNVYRQYARWSEGSPVELNGLYFLETSPSQRVLGYRILDALALTIR